jgi:2-iminobutanoate/2-iminopropanoate deaminase
MDPSYRSIPLAAIFLSTATAASAAGPAQIERHVRSADSIIYLGVTVPASADLLILSGEVPSPIEPGKTSGLDAYGDTKTEAISVYSKIKASLEKLGYSMSDVVKLTVFVVGDPRNGGKADIAGVNEAYRMFFGTAQNRNLVARSTLVIAALANPNYLVEIEAIAAKVEKK